jgi:Right handed beta helix region
MLTAQSFKSRDRWAALCALLGVASALAVGGAMVAPPVADAASGYAGRCTETISPPTDPGAAESGMSQGQTLCLKSGTYDSITEAQPNYFNASGTAGKPIVVTSGPGQVATIQGSDWLQGAYVTLQYLNLNASDTIGTHASTGDFAGCSNPASDGVEIDASNVVLQDNNIYESVYRDELIGVNYARADKPVVNDVITRNNLGPAGSCKQLDHMIYDDYSTGLRITQNWFFDDPYGYGVQLYVGPTNTTISGNVFDDVLDGIVAASSNTGNIAEHNVGIDLPHVTAYTSGMFVNCWGSKQATVRNDAVYNAANGIGPACGGLRISGTNPVLRASPFVGGKDSDHYTLASNDAANAVAGYGLWNGQGPPSPNPATSLPRDPTPPTTPGTQPQPENGSAASAAHHTHHRRHTAKGRKHRKQ